ncbi:MAG TPA: hypothetical protein VFT12_10175 [Thermoanaerobaculia bacterium]|nr:hypothetical protein [Thermoanaerobaculia bacterium]
MSDVRQEAEQLLRSSIIDVATYLDVIEVEPTMQVEIMGALAQASRVADAIAGRAAAGIERSEVADLHRVAERLESAAIRAGGHNVQAWVREASTRIASFALKLVDVKA